MKIAANVSLYHDFRGGSSGGSQSVANIITEAFGPKQEVVLEALLSHMLVV